MSRRPRELAACARLPRLMNRRPRPPPRVQTLLPFDQRAAEGAARPQLPAPLPQPEEDKLVVQKVPDFRLRDDHQAEVPDNCGIIHIFQVERTDGKRMWLKAEEHGPSGWAAADQVVATGGEAIAFFTKRLLADPKDAFSHLMRAVVMPYQLDPFAFDEQALDNDLAEAIRLDPRNAKAYALRGSALSKMEKYDKAVVDFTEAIRLDAKCAHAYFGAPTYHSTKTTTTRRSPITTRASGSTATSLQPTTTAPPPGAGKRNTTSRSPIAAMPFDSTPVTPLPTRYARTAGA